MSAKKIAQPAAWKNTYFWIAGILLIVAIIGLPLFGGDRAIRDPGQKKESWLWIMYLVAAVVMFINGWLSHRLTVQHFEEQQGTVENS